MRISDWSSDVCSSDLIIEANLFAKTDRCRIAAVLPTNAEFQIRAGGAAAVLGDRNQLADAFGIEADERVLGVDALFDIGGQEPARVVARHAKRGLGEIVGAEAEGFSHLGD